MKFLQAAKKHKAAHLWIVFPTDLDIFHEPCALAAVGHKELRLREAERLGFRALLMPAANRARLEKTATTLQVVGVQTVQDVVSSIFLP